MKLFTDDKGKVSAMRLIAVCGAFVGMGGVVASIVAMFLKLQPAVGMAGIMAGLITTAMSLKWAQKHEETKAF